MVIETSWLRWIVLFPALGVVLHLVLGRRRPGLALGYGLAVVGAVLGMAGVLASHFVLFLAGMTLFGVANTSNLLARYAAADVTPASERGRAMGFIVWGSTIGSILGPNLMTPAAQVGARLGLSPVGSAFLISVAGYALAALLVELLLRPDPLAIARRLEAVVSGGVPTASARRLGTILREPRVHHQVTVFTVHRNKELGAHEINHPLFLFLARMSRHVHIQKPVVVHRRAFAEQVVEGLVYHFFVAGNRASRQNDSIARAQGDVLADRAHRPGEVVDQLARALFLHQLAV